MSSYTSISPDKLARLIGTAKTPALIDVRTDEDFAADPRLIPGAVRRDHQQAADWGKEFSGCSAIVVCLRGQKLAQGTAAWLRHLDVPAEALGLLAASLGLSRMYDDDLEQLEAGIALYDAFYRWCRDATGETHNWPTNKAKP